jgi:2-polyprenyl-3-methyl-5-hydroxy-6-metoxy-1,4-benzoquinol methylase
MPLNERFPKDSPYEWRKGSIEFNGSWTTQGGGGRTVEEYCKELLIKPEDLHGKRVLDLGAGLRAELARGLAGKADVTSVSPDYSLIEYKRHVLDLGAKAVAAVGQELPFRQASFDVIVMLHVTEHVSQGDLAKIVQEAYRVLKPGGMIYIAPLLNHPSLVNSVNTVKQCLPRGAKVSFQANGLTNRFDLRDDPSGPHIYVRVDLHRAAIQKPLK